MSDIIKLEKEIEDAKSFIDRRKLALKLENNKEFRKLFIEDYFVKEAANYAYSAGDVRLDPQMRSDAMEMAKATGHAKRYLEMIIQAGQHYERNLPDMEATLTEMRAEEDSE